MRRLNHPSQGRRLRGGNTTVMMILALLLLAMATAALVQTVSLQRRVVKSESTRLQAEWLATSAAQRAAVILKSKPDYTGETWNITAEELGESHGARVAIQVTPDAQQAQRRRVAIQVELPPGPDAEARISREVLVKVTPK